MTIRVDLYGYAEPDPKHPEWDGFRSVRGTVAWAVDARCEKPSSSGLLMRGSSTGTRHHRRRRGRAAATGIGTGPRRGRAPAEAHEPFRGNGHNDSYIVARAVDRRASLLSSTIGRVLAGQIEPGGSKVVPGARVHGNLLRISYQRLPSVFWRELGEMRNGTDFQKNSGGRAIFICGRANGRYPLRTNVDRQWAGSMTTIPWARPTGPAGI